LKILHLIYDHIGNPWVGGGGAVRAYEIYRRLAQRHDVTVVCGKYPAASDHREGNLAFRFVGTASDNYVLSTFCYALKAADYVKTAAGDYDVVVEDFAPYNPVFSFRRRRDAVVQLHQREGLRHLKKYALLGVPFFLIEKYYPRLFRNAVVISELSRDAFGLGGRAAIIPNGFEKAVLEQETEDGGYILFLGRPFVSSIADSSSPVGERTKAG
jgi:glycogen(starch) synthase